MPGGGVCSWGGAWSRGGVCSQAGGEGCLVLGGVCSWGGPGPGEVVSQHALRQTSPWEQNHTHLWKHNLAPTSLRAVTKPLQYVNTWVTPQLSMGVQNAIINSLQLVYSKFTFTLLHKFFWKHRKFTDIRWSFDVQQLCYVVVIPRFSVRPLVPPLTTRGSWWGSSRWHRHLLNVKHFIVNYSTRFP